LVAAGNTVIGVAGTTNNLTQTVNNVLPVTTPVTATVVGILTRTGQTIVQLGNGNSLILNGTGGVLGDLLKIDLGSKTVIGGPKGSPLIGVAVLSPTGGLLNVAVGKPGTAGATGLVGGVGNTVNGLVGGVTGGTNNNGGLLGGVTGATGNNGLLGGVASGNGTNKGGLLGTGLLAGGQPKPSGG
jgi:hypothetical protein